LSRRKAEGRPAAGPTVCQNTARLAAFIAADASVLVELFSELINAGGETSNTLHCAMAVVSRMGMSADLIARANGADAIYRDEDDWMVQDGAQHAVTALRAAGGSS
jgi:hypothetical protein